MHHDGSSLSSDPLFDTDRSSLLEIWDTMQRVQTDFALPQELSFYYTSPQWRRAESVLDLGTGNGYYLQNVARRFPDKTYKGIDLSAEFIAIAESESSSSNVSFACCDALEVTQRCDFVLMRLLLQHVENVDRVLDRTADMVNRGGSALIVDAHDPTRHFYPNLPEFMEFFAAYAENERKAGRDRRVAERVDRAIAASGKWKRGETLQLLIPSTLGANHELFTRTYLLLLDLVEQVGALDYDFDLVRSAWRRWADRTDAYTQVGLNLIRIDRV